MTSSSKVIDLLHLSIVLVLAVILVVESAAFSHWANIPVPQEESNDQDDAGKDLESNSQQPSDQRDDNNHDFEIKAQEAIVPIAQLHLSQALFFIYELKLVKETNFNIFHDQVIPGNQYFLTLLRLIIAPNAP